jgi:hypothetical protein
MTIACSLSSAGRATTWPLKCDTVDHQITRFVTQSPLPASGSGTAGSNFWLDLGMQLEQITITGLVDIAESPAPGGGNFPSMDDLETACQTWWAYISSGSVDPSTLPQLTVAGNQVYTVAIKQADFKLLAAEETRWQYTIVFVVGIKVSG